MELSYLFIWQIIGALTATIYLFIFIIGVFNVIWLWIDDQKMQPSRLLATIHKVIWRDDPEIPMSEYKWQNGQWEYINPDFDRWYNDAEFAAKVKERPESVFVMYPDEIRITAMIGYPIAIALLFNFLFLVIWQWEIASIVTVAIFIAFTARYGRRTHKALHKHIKDPEAHEPCNK